MRPLPAGPVEIASCGPVARPVHWAAAALAFLVVALGWAMLAAPRGGDSCELLLFAHRSVGVLILALMVFRTVPRLTHSPPPFPSGFPRIEAAAAHVGHALLYVVFLVMPLSGLLNAASAGHPVAFSACSRARRCCRRTRLCRRSRSRSIWPDSSPSMRWSLSMSPRR